MSGRVLPVVFVDDVSAYARFLIEAFGFQPGEHWTDETDPEHVNVEVHLGPSTVSICRASPDREEKSLDDHFGFYVEVEDVETHLENAVARGATITSPLERQPWGKRMYGARDPAGYGWSFAGP